MTKLDMAQIGSFICEQARSPEYREFMVTLLRELIEINNLTTGRPLADITADEHKAFDRVENTLRGFCGPDVVLERCPIDPKIGDHPYYTRTYYTADESHPQGLPAAESYRDRVNLLAMVRPKQESPAGRPVILNAHIDTVAPFFPCKVDDKVVHGRGACDDKGSVVTLVAVLKLWTAVQARFGSIPHRPIVFQFVIEEEPGGNGSLSAALDKRFRGYEAIICEATKNIPYPANRGAMWFQMDLDAMAGAAVPAEIAPFIVYELAKEGRQLRAETNEPLFPKEYVQVNLGTIGNYGRHPSAVNDGVSYELAVAGASKEALVAAIEAAVAAYTRHYADRTRETHPETKQPKLARHYTLTPLDGKERYKLEIHGVGGHMGAMLLCDNALIKAAFILTGVYRDLRAAGAKVEFRLAAEPANSPVLVLTGGVGFTPAHQMADLQVRLRRAAQAGVQQYNAAAGTALSPSLVTLTFDKLHNEAYASPTDCPGMKAFAAAYRMQGLPWPKPIAWRASCDARIYGNNGYNTITFGPGDLADAHSDHEKIAIDELQKGLELLTLTTLLLTTGECP